MEGGGAGPCRTRGSCRGCAQAGGGAPGRRIGLHSPVAPLADGPTLPCSLRLQETPLPRRPLLSTRQQGLGGPYPPENK